MINITDDLELDTTTYTTIIIEQAPLPPQNTIFPSQPTSPEPMQLDLPDPSKKVQEPTT